MVIASCIIHQVSHYAWPFIGSYWRYGWPRTRRRRRAPCKLSVSLLQLFCYLVPRSLSLDENLRAKEGGKEQRGETRFASLLYPSHGPLRFVLSHSRFALASIRNQAKNGAPEERLAVLDNTRRIKILGFSATSIKPLPQHPLCLPIKAAISSRSCKSKCERERGDSFSPSHICISSGFGSSIGTI